MKSIGSWFIAVALVLITAPRANANTTARTAGDFLWGVAFSAHQTEGVTGGGEAGDWWRFEHPSSGQKSPIENSDHADLAVDHWHRYPEDLGLAQKMGLNTVRTSLAWEKIEPARGVFSTEALRHYRAELQAMREEGLRPMIALHHFTHPQWFNDLGGWTSPESPKLFLEYATRVVRELGDLCDLWITFNEPMVLVIMGYLKGEVPPQLASLDAAFEAAYEMARAHRMVAAMIHLEQGLPQGGTTGGVGLANSFHLYDPYNPRNVMDQKAAETVADLNNWAFVRGIEQDRMEFKIPEEVPGSKSFSRAYPADDLPAGHVGPMMDWIGVNYYSRYLIRYDATNSLRVNWVTPSGPQGDNGWAIYPQGLEQVLRQTAERFHYPLIVTENGLADGDDSRRPEHIRKSLASLDRAMSGEGGPALDVRGYYHWTLTDNFEWLYGYRYRFGLYEVDYANGLARKARPSVGVLTEEIARRRAPGREFARAYGDGFAVVPWDPTMTDDVIRAELRSLAAAGAKHVTVTFLGCQTSRTSADVGACEVTPYELPLRVAKLARELGFDLSFLPIVLTPDGVWRGFFEPEDVDGWFKTYTAWLLRLARDAKRLGASELVAGTEFTRLYQNEEHWKQLLRTVKQAFDGPVTLTVNWGDLEHSFWNESDAIGVSAYYPLAAELKPSQEQLDASWARLRDELLSVAQRWNRPLHITEVGYTSSNTTARTPWTLHPESVADPELQAGCFRAFAKAWGDERRLARFNVWAMSLPVSDDDGLGFEVLGKPAEGVLKNLFERRLKLREKSR